MHPQKSSAVPFELTGSETAKYVDYLRKILDDREFTVLYRTIALGETLQVVGNDLKITKERVRQIRDSAIAKAREFLQFNEARRTKP